VAWDGVTTLLAVAVDVAPLVVPTRTALLFNEVQANTVGGSGALAVAAAKRLPAMVELVVGARAAGVQVLHCVKVFRRDSLARNRNTPLYRRLGALPTARWSRTVDRCPVRSSLPRSGSTSGTS